MTRAELENKLAKNARFKQAEPSAAVVIVGAKPTPAVDLSRYSPAEREIIEVVARDKGRPLTQEEINMSLEQGRFIHGDDLG
jgi:hypothetical protein